MDDQHDTDSDDASNELDHDEYEDKSESNFVPRS